MRQIVKKSTAFCNIEVILRVGCVIMIIIITINIYLDLVEFIGKG